jgi:tRNA pseudouridine38-40 synthase
MNRNIRLTVEYDGTPYRGWQPQTGLETVRGVLESKLADLCGHKVSLLVAGRTDAGVHALGQVCNFHTTSRLSVARFRRVINQLLPHSIRVRDARVVPPQFHATYHAKAKLYRYIIRNRSDYTVFDRHTYHHLRKHLDVAAMRRAARHLEGRHDFSAFCGILGRDRNPIRNLIRLRIRRTGPGVFVEYYGESFLHQMVRILSGTLMYVGLGKIRPEDIPAILSSKDRKRAGPTLPPTGLFLVRVDYPKVFKPIRSRAAAAPRTEEDE